MTITINKDAERWTSQNPVLPNQVPGFEKDTGKLKIGDGVTKWNALPYEDSVPYVLPSSFSLSSFLEQSGPSQVQRRDFPMRLPRVLSSPPAVTAGTNGTTAAVAGAIFISAFEPGAFTYLGGPAGVSNYASPNPVGAHLGTYPYKTSATPVMVEFWLDITDPTGRFEINWSASGPVGAAQFGVRVAIQQADGSWGYITDGSTFAHQPAVTDLITLGTPGVYKIRLEFAGGSVFNGVHVALGSTVSATTQPKRWLVIGDSFAEPTIVDSGVFVYPDGWVQRLSYLTGLDLWSAGSGGTGYIQPNTAGGRVKFRDRLAADIFAMKPDGILWAGGINDTGHEPAVVAAEAVLCWKAAKDAGVLEQIVMSPFWSKTLTIGTPSRVIDLTQRLKAEAESMGLPYLNLLELPDRTGHLADWTGSALQAAVSAGATSISVASIPNYFKVAYVSKNGWYIRIGVGNSSEIRRVTNITGTGPYTLTITGSLTFAWPINTPIFPSGGQYITGDGKQGTLKNNGTADRYTSSDGTHPTKAGHLHIARTVASLWAYAIQG